MLATMILTIAAIVTTVDFYSNDSHLRISIQTTLARVPKPEPVVPDGNAILDFQDGASRSFWLLGREANFLVNAQSAIANSRTEITAGIDPCGRQSLIELSFAGNPPIELGTSQKSVSIYLATPNIHVRALGPVCLIASDPRTFFGQLSINLNSSFVPFDFSQ